LIINRRFLTGWMLAALIALLCRGSAAQSDTVPFPLGFMGPSVDNVPLTLGTVPDKLNDVAAAGFNIVHELRAIQEIGEAELYLSQADTAGVMVVQNMPRCRAYISVPQHPECLKHPEVGLWSEAEWTQFITTTAAHDSLVAWFLPDEIDNYEVAADLYQLIHEHDPLNRPVYVNPGSYNQSDIDQFPAFADFLWAAAYPHLTGKSRALATHMMAMDAHACQGTDTQWGVILEYFDSAEFPQYGSTGHPTPRELRSDSYQAIIGGGTGLWHFNYEMGRVLEQDLWDEIATIADEIGGSGGLDEVILAPDVPRAVEKRVISGPSQSPVTQGVVYESIQFLQKWREADGTYIFAVNVATDTVTVEFSNLQTETDTIEVLFEGRSIPISDNLYGSYQDTFAQDDVHIYFYADPEPPLPLTHIYMPVAKRDQ
jgi:hypothetical protein